MSMSRAMIRVIGQGSRSSEEKCYRVTLTLWIARGQHQAEMLQTDGATSSEGWFSVCNLPVHRRTVHVHVLRLTSQWSECMKYGQNETRCYDNDISRTVLASPTSTNRSIFSPGGAGLYDSAVLTCDQHTQTHMQTALRATSATIAPIYTRSACVTG